MDKRSGFNEWLNDTHGRVALRVGKADKSILAMEAHQYEYGFFPYTKNIQAVSIVVRVDGKADCFNAMLVSIRDGPISAGFGLGLC